LFHYDCALLDFFALGLLLTEVAANNSNKDVENAEFMDTFIVTIDFLEDCFTIVDNNTPLLPYLKKHSLVDWGSEVRGLTCIFVKIS